MTPEEKLKEENARFREALEWIAEYSAHLAADSVDTLPAAYMRGFRRCQTRAWAALRREK